MTTVKIDESNFESEVLKSEVPVVLDFWAEWCGPCKMIGPALEELSNVYEGRAKIAKLNVDENPEIAARYGVRSIPTLVIVKNGSVADIKVGAAPKAVLAGWIQGSL
ncbi:thioredoxin [Rhizobium laguerreae]|uniref:thioredoxin n=1 Tax=Rhizobium laguerreae TaxID=1076926 RepID=UPI001C925B63|nr:thioredoxin [Rhizobium laguerreae]MBY3155586.1 thioredoxin [Rhizobium laguerreae]